jgi:hypothetical protein
MGGTTYSLSAAWTSLKKTVGSGSRIRWYGIADLYQNVTNPEHCKQQGRQGEGQGAHLRNNQNVREDYSGIQIEAPDGLQRHLAGQLRSLAHREEVCLGPHLLELWQIAACLPHHPDRGAVHRLAPGRPQQPVVL